MKIIEIIDEGVLGAIKGVASGASEFVSGATGGEVDIKNTWNKYIKTPKGTTRSINANLPPQEQFDRILVAIYGNEGKSNRLRQEWANAINSGRDTNVENIGDKYRDIRRPEGLEGDKLKTSHKTVIDDLIRMAKNGQTFEAEPKQSTDVQDEKL